MLEIMLQDTTVPAVLGTKKSGVHCEVRSLEGRCSAELQHSDSDHEWHIYKRHKQMEPVEAHPVFLVLMVVFLDQSVKRGKDLFTCY